MELRLRHTDPRRRDPAFRKINANFSGRAQPAQQPARAAADLEHARAGRDQQVVVVGENPVVAARHPVRRRWGGIVEGAHLVEVVAGEFRAGGGRHIYKGSFSNTTSKRPANARGQSVATRSSPCINPWMKRPPSFGPEKPPAAK